MNKTAFLHLTLCLLLFSLFNSPSLCNKGKTYEDIEEVIKNASSNGVRDFEEEIEKKELTKPISAP